LDSFPDRTADGRLRVIRFSLDYIGCPALRDWDPGRSLEEEWLGKYIASNDGVQRIVVATVPPDAGKEFVERGNPIFVPESVPGQRRRQRGIPHEIAAAHDEILRAVKLKKEKLTRLKHSKYA
jgi:hypothetical protein